MEMYLTALKDLILHSGFFGLTTGNIIMLVVSFVLLYLAIGKGFEPLLLVPIAFGCLLVNLPLSGIWDEYNEVTHTIGFLRSLYYGAEFEIY
ncbi:MAG: sodium ion-translocating decarboxylase subunit beta, partial [Synergistaceae bacterium]|nr:sodium ion-translocating decarboxylase subunit beta [Synergistaceae bacterium]